MNILARIMGSAKPEAAVVRAEPVVVRAPAVTRGQTLTPQMANAGFVTLSGGSQSRVKNLPYVSPVTAERHATVTACCSIAAGDMCKVPLIVWQRNKDGSEGPVQGHPANYLLNVEASAGVPAAMARFDLAYSFLLRGRAYGYAPRDGGGELELIDVLHPDLVSEFKQGRARFYQFKDGDEVTRTVAGRSVIHMRYMALDGWTGRSPLQVASESIALALAGQEAAARAASGTHMKAFAKMDASIGDDEQYQRSAVRLRNHLNDPDNNGLAIIEGGELKSLDLSAADQELLASRQFDREMIAGLYRMPIFKLQIANAGVKANGQQAAIDYKTDCLTHWGGLFSSFASMTLLTEAERRANMMLVHDWDALMEATMVEAHNAIKVATGGPFMTANEGRAMRGLPPLEGGDILYPPANMTAPSGAPNKEDQL